jgi:hypothetical protein
MRLIPMVKGARPMPPPAAAAPEYCCRYLATSRCRNSLQVIVFTFARYAYSSKSSRSPKPMVVVCLDGSLSKILGLAEEDISCENPSYYTGQHVYASHITTRFRAVGFSSWLLVGASWLLDYAFTNRALTTCGVNVHESSSG